MALISCPECGKSISDMSDACVHCGYPLSKQDGRDEHKESVQKEIKASSLNEINAVKSYLRPSVTKLILPIICVIIGIAAMWSFGIQIFLLMMGFGGLVSIPYFHDFFRMNSAIKKYSLQFGEMDIIEDFNEGDHFVDDGLRLGEKYIFGSGVATIVRYEEISNIYLYIHKTNWQEDERAIKIRTTVGKSEKLCRLPIYKKGNHPDLEKIILKILNKNPRIHVGYEN